jgi:hypothetical protein
MSDDTDKPIPPARDLPLWKMVLLAIPGIILGKMLADGIMPFQVVPFEAFDVPRRFAPWLIGWALAVGLDIVRDLHNGIGLGLGKAGGKLRIGLARVAHWLAARLQPAEAVVAEAAKTVEQAAAPKNSPAVTPSPAIPAAQKAPAAK